jgi:DNA-binding helix-hairpin-helix protein with protein kinase domain
MKLSALSGCVLLAGLASGSCLAGAEQAASSVPEILQMQHALRARLEAPTGEFSRFDHDAVRRMEAAQDQVFKLLDGVSSIDQLTERQKVDLSNALEQVRSTLLAQSDNRVICHIERKTGTNLTSRRCETVGSRNKSVEESRVFMADHPHHYYDGN